MTDSGTKFTYLATELAGRSHSLSPIKPGVLGESRARYIKRNIMIYPVKKFFNNKVQAQRIRSPDTD